MRKRVREMLNGKFLLLGVKCEANEAHHHHHRGGVSN